MSERLGKLAIVKRRIGGYDGHGQWRLCTNETEQLSAGCYSECIVGQSINFPGEVPLIDAHGFGGSAAFYPLIHNLHQGGTLHASVAFPRANAQQQAQAGEVLSAIMQELGYTDMAAMECFVTLQGLLINELTPHVHSSGYWARNGASTSQFELHLRAATDLPLPQPVVNNPSVTINLVGGGANYDWLKLSLMHLH